MKRNANRKGTSAYNKAHPKWTPERTEKFKATMRERYAKLASERRPANLNNEISKPINVTIVERPVNHEFVEAFVGMFVSQGNETKKSILCSLVAKL